MFFIGYHCGISFDTDFVLPRDNERDVGSLAANEIDNNKAKKKKKLTDEEL